MHHTGFFSVVGHGLTDEEVQRQYDIGQAFFAIPHEDKAQKVYKCDFASGNYFGYRELAEKTIKGTEVRDNVESFNHAKFTRHYENEPRHPFFEPYRPEIEAFSRVSRVTTPNEPSSYICIRSLRTPIPTLPTSYQVMYWTRLLTRRDR